MQRLTRAFSVLALVALWIGVIAPASAAPVSGSNFGNTWAYTDQPVATGKVNRTWMWGPSADSPSLLEPYAESPDGQRQVQYFDKTRMEISHPNGYASSIWYVTNGLLAEELITGRLQLGDSAFEQHVPAQVNVAGDANDPNGPTYATFNTLMGYGAIPSGWKIIQTVDRAGNIDSDSNLASYSVTAEDVGAPTHHDVASVFWDFMNSSGTVFQNSAYTSAKLFANPFYATGYPLTEAYWTNVVVGGVQKRVLVQVFERRVLTFTPSNPDGWKVEAGNVGQHYYTWRYQVLGKTPNPESPQPAPYNPDLRTAAYQGVSFTYDTSLASGITSSVIPPVNGGPIGQFPQMLKMEFDGYPISDSSRGAEQIVILSTAALSGTGNGYPVQQLQQFLSLHQALNPVVTGPSGTDPNTILPVLPSTNAAQMIVAKPTYLDFQSGAGVRWITTFAQQLWPVEPDQLWYVYQGLTADGEYYVSVMLPINAHLVLPPFNRQNMDAADVEAYNQQAVDQLQKLSSSGFTPNLDAIDAAVSSLIVTPTPSLAAALSVQQ